MSHHWGYVAAVVSAVLFGVSSTFNKIALIDVNPTVVAGLIYFIGGVVFFGIRISPWHRKILSKFGTEETEAQITRKDYRVLFLVIVCGSVVAPLLLLNGLAGTTAINTALLLNAEALFTFLIALTFLGERCSKREYLGIVFLLVGVVFVTTNGEFQRLTLLENLMGNVLIVGACLFWGIDNNLSRFLSKKKDIVTVTALKCFIGGAGLLGLSFLLGLDFSVSLAAVPYLVFVGAFSIALSVLLFLFALRKIGSMRTGVICSTSSLFGVVLAFAVLGETLTIIQIIAGLVMLLGVYVIYRCGS